MAQKRSSFLQLRSPVAFSLRPFLLIAMPLFVLCIWFIITELFHVNALILPSPVQTLKAFIYLFFERELMTAIWVSTKLIGISILLSILVAFPLGVLMGAYDGVFRLFDPIVAPLRYMPISAFIPLLIIWFGIDQEQKVAFLFLGTFVYLLPAIIDAIRQVPEELIQTSYTLGASQIRIIFTVLIPASLPSIFDSFRTLNAIAWTYVILAELVNPSGGLGAIFSSAYRMNKPDWSIAGLIVVGVIGLVSDTLINKINQILFRWRENS